MPGGRRLTSILRSASGWRDDLTRTTSSCSSGGREAGEECLVELEVDSCQVVDIGGRDAVDAPYSGGDAGRFGGKVNGDVAEVDAGDVADREYPRACDLLPVS